MNQAVFFSIFLISSLICVGQSTSGFISLEEDSIYYEIAGSGKNIVFIHDGLLHGEVWNEQFAFFSEDYKVIRYDRRGYGKSSPATGSYTHQEDLNRLYEYLQIDSAVLIACSSGGALAIDFALDSPEKVNALVLVGAVVGGFSYTEHMRTRGGHLPEIFENDMEENLYYVTDDPYLIYHKNTEVKKAAVEMLTAYPHRIHRRAKFIRPDTPPSHRLNEIEIPTLILLGEFDIPDVHAVSGAISNGIANSKRSLIKDSGHLIPMEQAFQFNILVQEFLEGE